jgi:MoaA/NifB/PqqE/SkfB family radical SAM enzyme
MNNILQKAVSALGKARLYTRVGLNNMTLTKAYIMLRYWVLTSIFKKEIPWVMEFSLTFRCQCKCVHCSVGKYPIDKEKELTDNEIKNVLEQAAKIGIPKIDFFGGEPLLRESIVDLVAYGAKKGLYMSITTNAWLLTKDLAKALKKAGISYISISLDSTDGKLHDRLRKLPGLYERVVSGIKYCYEEKIPCLVSTYITREGISDVAGRKNLANTDLGKIITFSKELKASGIRILFPIISGRWITDKEKMFAEEEKRKVIEYLDSSFAFIEGAYCVAKGKKVCQSLRGKMFHLSPYGEIQICVAFPDTFGNIKNTPLDKLLKDMYSHPTYLKNKNSDCCSTLDLKR